MDPKLQGYTLAISIHGNIICGVKYACCDVMITEGDDVLMRGRDDDGLIYLGVAVEFDQDSDAYLVRFGDGTEAWSSRQDLRLLGSGEEFSEDSPLVKPAVHSKPKYNQGSKRSCRTATTEPYLTPDRVIQARKELPYDFESLLWDENHQRNDKER